MQIDDLTRGMTQIAPDTLKNDPRDVGGCEGFIGRVLLWGCDLAEHRGFDGGRGERVDCNVERVAFAGGGATEEVQARLGGAIGGETGEGIARGFGGDIDDYAGFFDA